MEINNKQSPSERDICTQYITVAIQRAGCDFHSQVREEVSFTNGRIIVRGRKVGQKMQLKEVLETKKY